MRKMNLICKSTVRNACAVIYAIAFASFTYADTDVQHMKCGETEVSLSAVNMLDVPDSIAQTMNGRFRYTLQFRFGGEGISSRTYDTDPYVTLVKCVKYKGRDGIVVFNSISSSANWFDFIPFDFGVMDLTTAELKKLKLDKWLNEPN